MFKYQLGRKLRGSRVISAVGYPPWGDAQPESLPIILISTLKRFSEDAVPDDL